MDDGKQQLMRTKTLGDQKISTGKGVSDTVSKSIKNKLQESRRVDVDDTLRRSKKSSIRLSLGSRSLMSTISAMLDLEEYDFPEEEEIIDPQKIDAKLDVTALDRYNEDIRRIRKLMIDECRALPQKGDADERVLERIKLSTRALCRIAYYGTHKAQVLAEGAVILIIWLLNRKNLNAVVKIHIMQSLAEMMWTSVQLKTTLFKCQGIRILANILVNGIKQGSSLAKWACYTLAMTCVSSADAIGALLDIKGIDEVVGEIAFYYYWTDWPANFGSILQGILYGPHSVIPMEDTFDFI